jgi:hypothetical protein
MLTGFKSTDIENRSKVEPATVNPVDFKRNTLDVFDWSKVYLVTSGITGVSTSTSVLNVPGVSASFVRKGMLIEVNSILSTIIAVSSNTVEVAQAYPSIPGAGLLFKIWASTILPAATNGGGSQFNGIFAYGYDSLDAIQAPIPLTSTGTAVKIAGAVTLPANSSVNVNQWGGVNTTLGQKTSTASVPVVLPSDQAFATSTLQTTGNTTLTSINTNLTTANTNLTTLIGHQPTEFPLGYSATGTPEMVPAPGFGWSNTQIFVVSGIGPTNTTTFIATTATAINARRGDLVMVRTGTANVSLYDWAIVDSGSATGITLDSRKPLASALTAALSVYLYKPQPILTSTTGATFTFTEVYNLVQVQIAGGAKNTPDGAQLDAASIAGGGSSFVGVCTTNGAWNYICVTNATDALIIFSFKSGGFDSLALMPGQTQYIPLTATGLQTNSSEEMSARYDSVAPTTGNVYIYGGYS